MKNTLSKKGISIMLIALGILALAVGVSSLIKQKKYTPTTAVITQIDSEYDTVDDRWDYTTYVEYEVDGKKYNEILGFHQDGYEVGKVIDIVYNPADPARIEVASSGPFIYFTAIGPVVMVIGAVMLLKR